MLASWRVVRDFEVLEEGTGAGADVVCAVVGRKPARKDLDRRAAALVTTFLEWAEVVLESRGADIWYYCHYMNMNRDSGQVVTGGVGDPADWLLLGWMRWCRAQRFCCEGGGSFRWTWGKFGR